MAIAGLSNELPVFGFAKIGIPTAKDSPRRGAPIKLDHIELTSTLRDANGELCVDPDLMVTLIENQAHTCGGVARGCQRSKELADKFDLPIFAEKGLPTQIPIMLPYDDLDVIMPHRMAMYSGRSVFCTGDLQNAMRLQVIGSGNDRTFGEPVPHAGCGMECPDLVARRCKPAGRLRFLLAHQMRVGGVYEFRTTSWNSIRNLRASLSLMYEMTAGTLAYIPFVFSIAPQTVQPKGGVANTAQIARIEFVGTPLDLLGKVRDNLQLRAPMMAQIKQLEASLKSREWVMTEEEVGDFRGEFDHENLASEDGSPVIETTSVGGEGEGSEGAKPTSGEDSQAPVSTGEAPAPPTAPADSQEPGAPAQSAPPSPEPADDDPNRPLNEAERAHVWACMQLRAKDFPGVVNGGSAILRQCLNALGLKVSDDMRVKDIPRMLEAAKTAKLIPPKGKK